MVSAAGEAGSVKLEGDADSKGMPNRFHGVIQWCQRGTCGEVFRIQSLHFPKLHGANGTSPKMNMFNFHPTTFGVVGEILKKIKPNKVQGYDLIAPSVVQVSFQTIARPLSNLINTVITRSEVPDRRKHSPITPHHKKDSVLDKVNCDPIWENRA